MKTNSLLFASLAVSTLFCTASFARPVDDPTATSKPTTGSGASTTHSSKPSKKGMLAELQAQGGKVPDQLHALAAADASSCDYWWLSGSHSWNWKGVPGWYITASINAETHTYYGGQTDPNACGQPPLIVDKVSVDAHTNGGFYLRAQNTAFNASSVQASDSGWHAGSGSDVCGAHATHYAEKWGVQWNSVTNSGCN